MNNGKETLRAQISMLIQKRIREGEYKPGERIVETHLCKELSVSQAPVREAILELVMMGILEERPYSGTFVRDITPEEIIDIFNVRAFIEEHAVSVACANGTEEDFGEIEEIVHRMENCINREEYTKLDTSFHEGILKASGSEALLRCWRGLHISQWTYQSILNTARTLEQLTAEHRKIFELIKAGHEHAAVAEMFLHIRSFGEEMTEYLMRDKSGN